MVRYSEQLQFLSGDHTGFRPGCRPDGVRRQQADGEGPEMFAGSNGTRVMPRVCKPQEVTWLVPVRGHPPSLRCGIQPPEVTRDKDRMGGVEGTAAIWRMDRLKT